MKITDNRNSKEEMITINDLLQGDVFTFLIGDLKNWICLMTDNGFVTLSDGDSDFEIYIYENLPVEKLDVELIVKKC